MFCNQCGNEIPNGVKFCPSCGAPVAQPEQPSEPVYAQPVEPAQPVQQQPVYAQPIEPSQPPVYAQPEQPQYAPPQQPAYTQPMAPVGDPTERAMAKSNLIFGILSIGFSCSFYLSFLGLIFGIISMKKAKEYAAYYPLAGKAKVGSILGKVGFIVGIVLTVILLIVILVAACSACANSSSTYYYY